ncbi:TPA: hypothetical protein OOF39_002195 [Kluyvera ascorbata]|nr:MULTISPECIES: hypothetical protein [Kluyvera]MDA8491608.1 hypothetical protein [Kluyvera sp. Awk 3]QIR25264.1 hypothetical protein GY169_10080 [Kluyvera genomosp. 3]HCR3982754.1 hypothetical protein [Kluyvera ascorbata]HDT6543944.1 hypothetical protein [Kluyvera ascorbata]
MNNTRTYPAKRRRRGEVQNASLTMLSARIADDLCEYVREVAFQTRKSKQQIITEALMLHQANGIETHE